MFTQTMLFHYKEKIFDLFLEKIFAVFPWKPMEQIRAIFGENSGFFNVKSDGNL
jgi:hypothetical protein